MKVTTERTADCKAIVTVEVEENQVTEAMKTVAQRISRARPVPGFRPGKAPYANVERAVGREVLRDEAVEEVAQRIYKQVLVDEKIEPYDQGNLEVQQKDPLVLKFTIPTAPVIQLGDYGSVHMQQPPITITDQEVQQVLDRFQSDQAQMVPVTRPAQMGDMLMVDVNGGLEGQDPNENKGLQVRMDAAKPLFPWLDQLVGMNANETRTVTYTYPAEESNPNLAGKTATYQVTVTDIKEQHLPPVDDELAKAISAYETLDQLRGYIRTTLTAQKQDEEDSRFADEVIDAVVNVSEIAYPASMLEDEIDQDVARSKEFAQRLGMTWDKYLQLAGKTEKEFREDQRPRAEVRLKRLLVLLELIKAENIEISSKEVDVEIDRRAQQAAARGERADQVRRALSNKQSRSNIEFNLKIVKALERMVAMAKGEPTSGKIMTPEMFREEQRAQQASEANRSGTQPPVGLITDPSQVRSEDWPRGLDRPIIPGQEK